MLVLKDQVLWHQRMYLLRYKSCLVYILDEERLFPGENLIFIQKDWLGNGVNSSTVWPHPCVCVCVWAQL